MAIKLILCVTSVIILLRVSQGCQGVVTNTGIVPPYGAYLAFDDKVKAATLETKTCLVERVNLNDSTKVVKARYITVNSDAFYSSKRYTYVFRLIESDSLVVTGLNKFRLTYSGKTDVDWLVFYNRYQEGPQPEQVKFNGKEIPRQQVDEPVSPSYLYVLK